MRQEKILVIGSGGREHALCLALAQSASRPQLFCAPGNAGIAQIAECVPLKPTDVKELARFAVEENMTLTVIGPEVALAAGVADEFQTRGLTVFGVSQAAARLESSKAFAKDFMARHNIPTARYQVVNTPAETREILDGKFFGDAETPLVVKADGLAAGKGVVLARNADEVRQMVGEMLTGKIVASEAGQKIVLEETLQGREVSLLLFADGKDYALMPAARDHKRIGEGDTGANTGGMGVVTAPDVLDAGSLAQIERDIVQPTLTGAVAEGFPLRGVLFIGLMLTADGAKVLEYNVRFGDPEAQAVLVRLQSDFVEICRATAEGKLGEIDVRWSSNSSACVVLAVRGYPQQSESGATIHGLEQAEKAGDAVIFHAGTKRGADGQWLTAGGRVLGVTATGENLTQALSKAYCMVELIRWDGMQYRRDIGAANSSGLVAAGN